MNAQKNLEFFPTLVTSDPRSVPLFSDLRCLKAGKGTTQNKIYNMCESCCARQSRNGPGCVRAVWPELHLTLRLIKSWKLLKLLCGTEGALSITPWISSCFVYRASTTRRTWIELLRHLGNVHDRRGEGGSRVHSDHPDRFDSFIKSTQVNYEQLQS